MTGLLQGEAIRGGGVKQVSRSAERPTMLPARVPVRCLAPDAQRAAQRAAQQSPNLSSLRRARPNRPNPPPLAPFPVVILDAHTQ